MNRNALKEHLSRCENLENLIIITIRARSKRSVPALEQLLSQGEGRNPASRWLTESSAK